MSRRMGMSWRAHPLQTVKAPDPLPLSLPAGVRLLAGGKALTVPVLEEDHYYRARWEFTIGSGLSERGIASVWSECIDWSTAK